MVDFAFLNTLSVDKMFTNLLWILSAMFLIMFGGWLLCVWGYGEVMSSNLSWVKLEVRSTSVKSRT